MCRPQLRILGMHSREECHQQLCLSVLRRTGHIELRTGETGHVHAISALNLCDDTVGRRLGEESRDGNCNRVTHFDGLKGKFFLKRKE